VAGENQAHRGCGSQQPQLGEQHNNRHQISPEKKKGYRENAMEPDGQVRRCTAHQAKQ
jgi:hypothetical protein